MAADQTILEQSLENLNSEEPFVSRQSVYVIDSNAGSYNGQIQIDTSSLSNSGRWVSYAESVLQVPLVVSMEGLSTVAAQTATNPQIISANVAGAAGFQTPRWFRKQFALGLKAGYHQLIHSMSIELNNSTIVQLTPYLNHFVTYKLMTTLGQCDLDKWGTHTGFFPDSSDAHNYDASAVANPAGKGSTNNRNLSFSTGNEKTTYQLASDKNKCNEGLRKRTLKCTNTQAYSQTTTPILVEAETKNLAKNYYKSALEAGTNNETFYVLAQIRMKDICDFVGKMPLTRGCYMRLLINTNTSEHKIGYCFTVAAGPAITTTHINNYSSTITGGSTPIIVNSAEQIAATSQIQGGAFLNGTTAVSADGAAALANGNYEVQYTVRTSIVKDLSTGVTHPIPNCRLYTPLYTMSNEEVSRYLTLQPTKQIVYEDLFQYQFDVEAGGTFNQLLTNGVANPKSLVLIPYIHSSANPTSLTGTPIGGTGVATLGTYLPPYQSPFGSEPGSSSPLISIRDYNVQLAGVNVYTSNTLYDFEAFRNELLRINGLNGGCIDGITSGLISQDGFATNFRYYVTDLSRRIKAEDVVPKSIQVSGTNTSAVKITVFCFLSFERQLTLQLDSGLVLG